MDRADRAQPATAPRTPAQTRGTPPGPRPGTSREVRQSLLDLLERLPQAAAIVVSAAVEVIAWNDLVAALMEDFSALPRRATAKTAGRPGGAGAAEHTGCDRARRAPPVGRVARPRTPMARPR